MFCDRGVYPFLRWSLGLLFNDERIANISTISQTKTTTTVEASTEVTTRSTTTSRSMPGTQHSRKNNAESKKRIQNLTKSTPKIVSSKVLELRTRQNNLSTVSNNTRSTKKSTTTTKSNIVIITPPNYSNRNPPKPKQENSDNLELENDYDYDKESEQQQKATSHNSNYKKEEYDSVLNAVFAAHPDIRDELQSLNLSNEHMEELLGQLGIEMSKNDDQMKNEQDAMSMIQQQQQQDFQARQILVNTNKTDNNKIKSEKNKNDLLKIGHISILETDATPMTTSTSNFAKTTQAVKTQTLFLNNKYPFTLPLLPFDNQPFIHIATTSTKIPILLNFPPPLHFTPPPNVAPLIITNLHSSTTTTTTTTSTSTTSTTTFTINQQELIKNLNFLQQKHNEHIEIQKQIFEHQQKIKAQLFQSHQQQQNNGLLLSQIINKNDMNIINKNNNINNQLLSFGENNQAVLKMLNLANNPLLTNIIDNKFVNKKDGIYR
jgi:hypothetical protein